ncbi:DUF6624 domain-containing protein [Rubricoccus marinus]|uniref:Uncharacterized protein n=1 Tax=Rubricoccus marinus TaxID=716817 RepID=A0A259U3Q9_9BACT|nr:DUF6624 domain-containing protein [Rubricoccus marinus]OZC04487.1 hypothetical protein BSZ36_16800 [Rubricoccus marinus]
MRFVLSALALLFASGAAAQSAAPDALPDSVRQRLQIELTHLKAEDQRVRYMYEYGTFSPCVADSFRLALKDLPIEENIARSQALQAEADARTSPEEKAALLQIMNSTDAAILARLREIIAAHGWPSDERTGADASPVVFLLHSPHAMDEMRDELLAEVAAGRLPAREFAMAVDKSRKVRGERQLYGTGNEFDAETRTILPPRIDSIEATNAARREIGLEPLAEYRIAGRQAAE